MRFCHFLFKGKPEPPSKPTVSDINATNVRVSWNPPDFDGGTPITGYLLEFKEMSRTGWRSVKMDKYTNTAIVVADLSEKTQYQFRVLAENQIGSGSFSTLSDWYKTLGNY